MPTKMTRGERRGLIGLLALLAVIVGVSIFDRGVKTSVGVDSHDYIDSVVSLSGDTSNVARGVKKRSKRVKKTPSKRQPIVERSPLDEKIPS